MSNYYQTLQQPLTRSIINGYETTLDAYETIQCTSLAHAVPCYKKRKQIIAPSPEQQNLQLHLK